MGDLLHMHCIATGLATRGDLLQCTALLLAWLQGAGQEGRRPPDTSYLLLACSCSKGCGFDGDMVGVRDMFHLSTGTWCKGETGRGGVMADSANRAAGCLLNWRAAVHSISCAWKASCIRLHGATCSPCPCAAGEMFAGSFNGQFLTSARRIRRFSRDFWYQLNADGFDPSPTAHILQNHFFLKGGDFQKFRDPNTSALRGDTWLNDPLFTHVMERAWSLLMRCWNMDLFDHCDSCDRPDSPPDCKGLLHPTDCQCFDDTATGEFASGFTQNGTQPHGL
jgi:hypothetical protein